mmetsp:Transcript_74274/g.193450  ORF Transcript_74274/g.193450 Transcript_74274/m.193450 type:complete len:228 (-) Transcript_74274:467-1150(-)
MQSADGRRGLQAHSKTFVVQCADRHSKGAGDVWDGGIAAQGAYGLRSSHRQLSVLAAQLRGRDLACPGEHLRRRPAELGEGQGGRDADFRQGVLHRPSCHLARLCRILGCNRARSAQALCSGALHLDEVIVQEGSDHNGIRSRRAGELTADFGDRDRSRLPKLPLIVRQVAGGHPPRQHLLMSRMCTQAAHGRRRTELHKGLAAGEAADDDVEGLVGKLFLIYTQPG